MGVGGEVVKPPPAAGWVFGVVKLNFLRFDKRPEKLAFSRPEILRYFNRKRGAGALSATEVARVLVGRSTCLTYMDLQQSQ